MGADDRGETLLELLVAVVIMGIALVAVISGFGVSILISDVHRKQATAGSAVRNYAEAIEHTVAGGGYAPCATTTTYASPAEFVVPPGGYAASVASVTFWNGTAWGPPPTPCTVATDPGLQQVSVQVASLDGRATERLIFVLRRCSVVSAQCI